ncbi:MAG TPA: DUF4149 domain-containing protein [Tepidisphaeraceae bacterium]|jgi:hypothetical protein
MRYLASALTVLATALWLGGLVTLVICATAIFKVSGLDRETAGRATSAMFVWFGRVQLGFAAFALIAAFLGYLQARGSGSVALFVLFALGAVGAVLFNMWLVPRLEEMRIAGQSQTPAFDALHKRSEQLMTLVTVLLLIASVVVPRFCRELFASPRSGATSPIA